MGGETAERGGRKRTNGERGAVNKGDVHTGILARLRTRIVDRSLASSLVACARRPTHDGGSTTSPLAGLCRVEVTGGGDMWLRTLASSRPVSDGFRVSIPVSAPYMPHLRGLVFFHAHGTRIPNQRFRNHRVPTLLATSSAIITSLLRTRYEVLRASIDHRSRLRYRGQVLLKEISERDAMGVRSHRTSRRGRRRPFGEEGEKAAEREKSRARCLQGERLLFFFSSLSLLFLTFYVSHASPPVSLFSLSLAPPHNENARRTRGRRSGETAVGSVRERPGGGQWREETSSGCE